MDTEVRKPRYKRGGRRGISKALNVLMKKVDEVSPDIAVKIIATAIAWEKVKSKIEEASNEFDPDNQIGRAHV